MPKFTIARAAKISKRSDSALYKAIKEGKIPHIKEGKYLRIEADNVAELANKIHSALPHGGFVVNKKAKLKEESYSLTETSKRTRLLLQIAEKFSIEELELILKL